MGVRILIRLLKFAIWLLPIGMACYAWYTVISPGFALWQTCIFVLTSLIFAYLAWHANRWIISSSTPEYWDRLRLAMLAGIAGAMLFSSTSAIILQNDQHGLRIGVVGSMSTSAARLTISTIMYAELMQCRRENKDNPNPIDCNVCIKPSYFSPNIHLPVAIGPVLIEYQVAACSTYTIRFSNLSPKACNTLLDWMDYAWLSKIKIGPDTLVSSGFNRSYAASCRSAPQPLVVELEYAMPVVTEWVEAYYDD